MNSTGSGRLQLFSPEGFLSRSAGLETIDPNAIVDLPHNPRSQSKERQGASRMTIADYSWFTIGALLAWPCVWLLIRFFH